MGQYNDCMMVALSDQGYGPGAVQDMLVDYLLTNGGLAGGLNDLWHQVWDGAGVNPGAFDDRAHTWLGDLGFSGALTDRWVDFWCSGGVITVETNLLLNNKLCDNDSSGDPDNWSSTITPNVVGFTESDIILFRRTTAESFWVVGAVDGLVYIAQQVALTAGDYTFSFKVDWRQMPINTDFKVGDVIATGITIIQDFPNLGDMTVPGWANCIFNISGDTDVTFIIRAYSPDANSEAYVFSRPQVVSGQGYKPATRTGSDCTGADIELLLDANGDPLKDLNGEYLYVLI